MEEPFPPCLRPKPRATFGMVSFGMIRSWRLATGSAISVEVARHEYAPGFVSFHRDVWGVRPRTRA